MANACKGMGDGAFVCFVGYNSVGKEERHFSWRPTDGFACRRSFHIPTLGHACLVFFFVRPPVRACKAFLLSLARPSFSMAQVHLPRKYIPNNCLRGDHITLSTIETIGHYKFLLRWAVPCGKSSWMMAPHRINLTYPIEKLSGSIISPNPAVSQKSGPPKEVGG